MFRRKKQEEPLKKEEVNQQNTHAAISTQRLDELLTGSCDFVKKTVDINGQERLRSTLFYFDGLVDVNLLDSNVLRPLMQEESIGISKDTNEIIDKILNGSVYHSNTVLSEDIDDCLNKIFLGFAALVFDEAGKAVMFDVKGFEKRKIVEPSSENVIKGSKESFVEVLTVNTALVRRNIATHKLKIEKVIVGRQTITPVAIVYIDGLTNQDIVCDLRARLQEIDVDGAITSGNIEEYIIDHKYTPFPQTSYTERVDTFCLNILEGRVGLLIDGLPIAYNVPITMNMFYRATEDYSQNYVIASGIRFLRYVSAIITTAFPAFYIAITTFHQEMIPSTFAISIIGSKEGVPFPTFAEVIIMLFAFEILLEAGIRLPKSIGQALSIVGALIVGEAAVNANAVSPIIVVVIAFTIICGFVIPNQDMSNVLRLIRLMLVILASIFGLFGVTIGIILVMIHESNLTSFGVPYMAPFSSTEGKDIYKNALLRVPMFMINQRPLNLKTPNKRRQR